MRQSPDSGVAINSIGTRIKLDVILICICYVCCVLSGRFPQLVLSCVVLFCATVLCCIGNAIAIWPIMVFYYSIFGLIFGVSVYRLFSLVYLATFIIRRKSFSFPVHKLLPLGMYVLYLVTVVFEYSFRTMIFAGVDIICVIALTSELMDRSNLVKFFSSYTIVALIAFITGIIINNSETVLQHYGSEYVNMTRFSSTFEDPNYMGFFYTVAVFAVITLNLFPTILRTLIVVGLYLIILTSMSMTAVVGNVLLWTVFLVVRGQIKAKTVLTYILCLAVVFGVYQYGLNNQEIVMLNQFCIKINDKMNALMQNDLDTFTTGRTSLSDVHLKVFHESSLWRQLFGGYAINSYFMNVVEGAHFSAHNEYVDALLNVGIIGWLLMFGYITIRVVTKIAAFRIKRDSVLLCGIMTNLIWLYYVATLTVFLDFRYMFAYFI